MASAFDVTKARAQFPALQGEQVYMDNAGGSQVLGTVADSIRSYLLNTNVQLGATYPVARTSTAAQADAYKAAASFINAKPEEINIGISTTQLLHNLSTALQFAPGDELVVSKLNHEANSAPWVRVAERLGLTVKWWASSDPTNPTCDVTELKTLLSAKTRLVACPHASNITGTISPIRAIADAVHSFPRSIDDADLIAKALLCVDGVALAPHRQVDVKALGADFYAFSWYKVYGPHVAQLYASAHVHDQIDSLAHFFKPTDTLDLKLNLASANYELTQSLPAVVAYFGVNASATWVEMARHEERLQQILLQFLTSDDRITIIGEPSPRQDLRVPVISFVVRGVRSQQVVEAVERRSQYGFRSGHMYSHRLLREVCDLADVEDGVVRVSFLHYNTEAEVQGLVTVLQAVLVEIL
ncbi:Pyridoxal phosphate-dependent transferase major region subdomain 2 [Penicillium macrosclerotiorum]|uniref:Pyridoxal phosphate-dependent transferase major region subdomain 2 n=1 Tax=Penicillium macrosclerotiorum TaxID=303699 RepID=UPI0025478B04|nr:Pyridoxal phosphate-dependent transferase major region subdomain 2 [Penicillium macrosclerotiorum]KAJ5699123.1 Pyridoxal phosphate-dependent transferase major region subdomain 2 [Penicillium macrosclerotiorum]